MVESEIRGIDTGSGSFLSGWFVFIESVYSINLFKLVKGG
jgi:hypothetical protein